MRIKVGHWIVAACAVCVAGCSSGGGPPPDSSDGGPPPGRGGASYAWSRIFGQSGDDHASGIVLDGNGDVIVAGHFFGAVDFGGTVLASAGLSDAFVVKLAGADGHTLWSLRFGNVDADGAGGVAVDTNGDVVLSGFFHGSVDFGGGPIADAGGGDAFVVRLAGGDGRLLWSQRFGGPEPNGGGAVAIDTSGDVIVAGNFAVGSYLVKLSGGDGSRLWSATAGGFSVAVGPTGDVVVTGAFSDTIDFGGGPLSSAGSTDIIVAQFAGANGVHQWSRRFGSVDVDFGYGVAVDAAGNVLATGGFCRSIDFGGGMLTNGLDCFDVYVVELSGADGHHLWSRAGDAVGDQARVTNLGTGVAVGGSAEVFVTGLFERMIDFGGGPVSTVGAGIEVFVAQLSGTDGSPRWARSLGGGGTPWPSLVAADAAAVIVTGEFVGTADFGGGSLTSAGGRDVFVVKLARF